MKYLLLAGLVLLSACKWDNTKYIVVQYSYSTIEPLRCWKLEPHKFWIDEFSVEWVSNGGESTILHGKFSYARRETWTEAARILGVNEKDCISD